MWRLVILLFCFCVSFPVTANSDGVEIVIVRDQNKLVIKKNNRTIKTFRAAFGSGGRAAKVQEGDRLTPKGHYRIHEVRSSDSFHTFMQLNYPNMEDAKRALKAGMIDRYQYRRILGAHLYNELPPQNTVLGGLIGIHGIGVETQEKLEIHEISNWTKGCIALRNSEIVELSRYVSHGTPVIIVDSLPELAANEIR
ncbi:ErfK/YbiS/YcfS/YnhG [Methylophaga frappieri]|uniref:ErfK/YbiS/YcfS/YnhG n=1 Tax=Methylophaga frappieri (strain ATCC BAA-2434 / DSM 25690 / JAM7) TaxID=754477 RepID=I1YEP5_METFJ|nr:L,D-transpeptidase [Methylophaga frappieri]AFJ01388.1 ErfK/YbiS/YcfS/YnhG [Methylophaga frappieri]